MIRRAATVAAALAACGSLTGCTSGTSSAEAHRAAASGSASTSTRPATTPAATPAATAPRLTAPVRTPLGAGERVWAAFSHRGVPYDTWWGRLEPLLSDAARAVYVYDDPRNLPSLRTTGRFRVAAKPPAEPRYTAEVVVPTSRGTFRLDLERHTLGSPWLLYAIRFPPGVH